jgi:integrase
VTLIAEMQRAGFAGWTIRGALVPLGRVLRNAERRGLIGSNPMLRLERGERPSVGRREQRILSGAEIQHLLDAADARYRPILATAAFTGLRLAELLGLVWAEVDFDEGFVRLRYQLERGSNLRVEPKTPQAVRDVVLMPSLGNLLREHRLASSFSGDSDFVFASTVGTPLAYRNVERRGLGAAADRAGLNIDRPRLRLHDLRHCFASILISHGHDIVSVSRQLGHASPDITLRVYAHLFDQARNADRMRDQMQAAFGDVLDAENRSVETEPATVIAFPRDT